MEYKQITSLLYEIKRAIRANFLINFLIKINKNKYKL